MHSVTEVEIFRSLSRPAPVVGLQFSRYALPCNTDFLSGPCLSLQPSGSSPSSVWPPQLASTAACGLLSSVFLFASAGETRQDRPGPPAVSMSVVPCPPLWLQVLKEMMQLNTLLPFIDSRVASVRRVPENNLPYLHKRPQVRMLLLSVFCVAVSVTWMVFRNEDQ